MGSAIRITQQINALPENSRPRIAACLPPLEDEAPPPRKGLKP